MTDTSETPLSDPPLREIQVDLEADELGIANRKAGERLRRSARSPRGFLSRLAVGLIFGLVGTFAYRSLEDNPQWRVYGPFLLLLLVVCASVVSGILARRRLLARLESSQPRHFTVRLGDEGIDLQSESGHCSHRWPALEAIDSGPAGICLHFRGFHSIWIPDRSFAHADARRSFLERVEAASKLQAGMASTPPNLDATSLEKVHFRANFTGNLKAGVLLLMFRPSGALQVRASVGQFIALAAAALFIVLGSDLILVGPRGTINWSALPTLLYGIPWLLLAPWAASLGKRQRPPLAGAVALAALWLPVDAVLALWQIAAQSEAGPAWLHAQGTGYLALMGAVAWGMVASMVALTRVLDLPAEERMAAVLAVICVLLLPSLAIQEERHLWVARYDRDAGRDRADYERRLTPARESALYAQPRLLDEALSRIKPGRPGKPELFLLAVGGNGSQDVFKREVESVQKLFDQRFGTAGHSLVLLNNPETVLRQPVASVTALQQTLNTLGKRMNRDEDVLLLFLTSHGSQDHHFDLSLWPYRFDELTPNRLRSLLDEAGIRYRVVVVSACYSGGFVPPLAGEDTLVISASRADRNSHGCSHEAEWTFFGKAFFDEALRRTTSFESAFSLASRAIAEREKNEELTPSEPQMAAGAGIRRALTRLEKGWLGANP